MKGRRLEKLIKYFVGPYKIKGIVLTNTVELVLSSIVQIHLVVNISKIQLYKKQVERQKKVSLFSNHGRRRGIWGKENTEQKEDMGKGEILSMIERIYSRGRYIRGERKPRKCKRSNKRVQKRVLEGQRGG